MASDSPSQYEFSKDQEALIGDLAHKMRWVGLFFIIVGILNLVVAASVLAMAFEDRLPADVVQQIPADVRDKLPPQNRMWSFVVPIVVTCLIYLFIGAWTRSAAASFQQIVATSGRDIGFLMRALGSLRNMYSLIYTLVVIALLMFLISAGLALYTRFVAR